MKAFTIILNRSTTSSVHFTGNQFLFSLSSIEFLLSQSDTFSFKSDFCCDNKVVNAPKVEELLLILKKSGKGEFKILEFLMLSVVYSFPSSLFQVPPLTCQ